MKKIQHNLIVVMPVFEDAEATSRLLFELASQFSSKVFVVAVDDGSVSHPLEISCLNAAGVDGVILKLSRNLGHQCAIAVGMSYLSQKINSKQWIVIMDSDGEDRADGIPILLKKLEEPDVDVAVGERKKRVETVAFKFFYLMYKVFFRMMTGKNINFGNFIALKANSLQRLVLMPEISVHLAAAVLASRLRIGACPIDRGKRCVGKSKMNFVSLILHGFRGIIVFAEDVLVRVIIACSSIAAASIFGILAASILKLFKFSTPGWFSVALGILVLMLLQAGAIALMALLTTFLVSKKPGTLSPKYSEFIEVELHTKKV